MVATSRFVDTITKHYIHL